MPDKKTAPEQASETAPPKKASVSERNPHRTKTAGSKRPKVDNTFLPGKHGLMITAIGHRDGIPVPAIQNLYSSLADCFGLDDPVAALLIELTVVDYWRLGQGHHAEQRLIEHGSYVFDSRGIMPTIIRYNAAARRNLEKSLQLLQQDAASSEQQANTVDKYWSGGPEGADHSDLLPASDFGDSPTEYSEQETAANTEKMQEEPTTSTPAPATGTADSDPINTAAPESAEENGANSDANQGDLPSAA